MAWLPSLRTQRAFDALLAARSAEDDVVREAIELLETHREEAVQKLLAMLREHGETGAIEGAISELLDDSTLPLVIEELRKDDPISLGAVARILAAAQKYDPNQLLGLFRDTRIPKTTLQRILATKQHDLDARRVVHLLGEVEASALPALSSLLHPVATERDVPDLVRHLEGADSLVRLHLVHTLSRFRTPEARAALERVIRQDPHRHVRVAALEALLKGSENGSTTMAVPALIALRDEDLLVRNKAIEVLGKLRTPQIVEHVVELLEDNSEVVRRSAIEVLTRICDPESVRALVTALRDKDWWVSNRAADALASIGGEAVIDGVLPLVDAGEDFLRRTASEVLQRLDTESTRQHLLLRYHSGDDATRSLVVKGLAALPGGETIDVLLELLQGGPAAWPPLLEALRERGDVRALDPLLGALSQAPPDSAPLVAYALVHSTDGEHAKEVEAALRRTADRLQIEQQLKEPLRQLAARFRHLFHRSGVAYDTNGQQAQPTGSPPDRGQGGASAAGADLGWRDTEASPSAGAGAPMDTGPVVDPEKLEADQVLAERFRVIRQIGSGGFGVVILVEDLAVNERIILKFAHRGSITDPTMVERFRGEVRSARRISHENVVRTHDLVLFGAQQLAISMEYFPSVPLSPEELFKCRDLRRAVHIVSQVCEGLHAAHRVGIVHRDLKPGNVLVGEMDHVKIADFGLAAAATGDGHRLTRTGLLMGTPSYMAPEQILGQPLDPRTDIYSFGVLLYEIFTGRLPYLEERPMAVLYQHVHGSPPPPRQIAPSIPLVLEATIQRAMFADPAGRYQSIPELLDDLKAVL